MPVIGLVAMVVFANAEDFGRRFDGQGCVDSQCVACCGFDGHAREEGGGTEWTRQREQHRWRAGRGWTQFIWSGGTGGT